MGITTDLRRALKSQFFPLLVERGFTLDSRHAPAFVDFRRSVDDEVQVIEFQWDNHGRPRFRLSFFSASKHGTVAMGMHTPADDVGPGQARRYAHLYPRGHGSSTRHWFCQDPPLWARMLGKGPRPASAVVDELIALFPEVEAYLSTGAVGPHCRESINAPFQNAG